MKNIDFEKMAKESLISMQKSAEKSNGFLSVYPIDKFVMKKHTAGDVFAVDGITAYGLLSFETEDTIVRPVFLDAQVWHMAPDEGRCGILHLQYLKHSKYKKSFEPHWIANWLSCGWLRTEELEMTPSEISERLLNDALDSFWWISLEKTHS